MDEGETGTLAATAEAEPGDGEDPVDVVLFLGLEIVSDLVKHLPGAAHGRPDRRVHLDEENALVLIGQERTGHAQVEERQGGDDHKVDQEIEGASSHDMFHATLVAAVGAIEAAVEETAEAALFF